MQAWANLLDASSAEPADVLPRFWQACQLPGDVAHALKAAEVENPEPFLRYMTPVKEFLSVPYLQGKWEGKTSGLSDHVLYSIEIAGLELDRHHQESEISQEELADLTAGIQDLRKQALTKGMDARFREFFDGSLRRLEAALSLYAIHGADALSEATYPIIGEIVLAHHDPSVDATKRKALEQLAALALKFNQVAAFAKNMKWLAAPLVGKLLGGG